MMLLFPHDEQLPTPLSISTRRRPHNTIFLFSFFSASRCLDVFVINCGRYFCTLLPTRTNADMYQDTLPSRPSVDPFLFPRHLLSDQSDPFNRKPLTMEQVVPAAELKAEIDAWRRQKQAEGPR